MLSLRFTISSTAMPFSASAPVGHDCTHLPQLVQLRDSPQGWFISLVTIAVSYGLADRLLKRRRLP